MDSIVGWNIRGLNWPNKQKDVKSFLYSNKVGLIGLLETKVKVKNVESWQQRYFPGGIGITTLHKAPMVAYG